MLHTCVGYGGVLCSWEGDGELTMKLWSDGWLFVLVQILKIVCFFGSHGFSNFGLIKGLKTKTSLLLLLFSPTLLLLLSPPPPPPLLLLQFSPLSSSSSSSRFSRLTGHVWWTLEFPTEECFLLLLIAPSLWTTGGSSALWLFPPHSLISLQHSTAHLKLLLLTNMDALTLTVLLLLSSCSVCKYNANTELLSQAETWTLTWTWTWIWGILDSTTDHSSVIQAIISRCFRLTDVYQTS